jgi:hypothetical protein
MITEWEWRSNDVTTILSITRPYVLTHVLKTHQNFLRVHPV